MGHVFLKIKTTIWKWWNKVFFHHIKFLKRIKIYVLFWMGFEVGLDYKISECKFICFRQKKRRKEVCKSGIIVYVALKIPRLCLGSLWWKIIKRLFIGVIFLLFLSECLPFARLANRANYPHLVDFLHYRYCSNSNIIIHYCQLAGQSPSPPLHCEEIVRKKEPRIKSMIQFD